MEMHIRITRDIIFIHRRGNGVSSDDFKFPITIGISIAAVTLAIFYSLYKRI